MVSNVVINRKSFLGHLSSRMTEEFSLPLGCLPNSTRLCVVTNISTTNEAASTYERSRFTGTETSTVPSTKLFGPIEQGKVTQEVIHFVEHTTIQSTLQYRPLEIEELKRIDRPNQADKL